MSFAIGRDRLKQWQITNVILKMENASLWLTGQSFSPTAWLPAVDQLGAVSGLAQTLADLSAGRFARRCASRLVGADFRPDVPVVGRPVAPVAPVGLCPWL